MKRAWVLLLAVGVVAIPLVVFDTRPAAACSCARGDDRSGFAHSDAVFVGELQDYDAREPMVSSADPAVWTFRVREVYKGDVARIQPVVSEISGASCGLEIAKRGEFLVFASTRGPNAPAWVGPDELYAGLCGGTRPATTPLEGAPAARGPTRATAVTVADDGGTSWFVPVLVASCVVVAVVGTALLLYRRSTMTTEP
jgi:hypothetical protein